MIPSTPHDLRPGDVVAFTIGPTHMRARVIEDPGHIGIGARQIVRLEALDEQDIEPEPRRFDLAAAEVELEHSGAK